MPVDLLPKPNPLTGRHHQYSAPTPVVPAPLVGWSVVSTNGSAGASTQPTLPAGIQNGDTMVMVYLTFGTVATAPTGWTSIQAGNNAGTTGASGTLLGWGVFTRTYATGFTPAALALTTSPNRGAYVAIGAFRPVGTATVTAQTASTATAGATSINPWSGLTITGTSPFHVAALLGWMNSVSGSAPAALTQTPTLSPTLEQLESGAGGVTGSVAGAASVMTPSSGITNTTTIGTTLGAAWGTAQVAAGVVIGIADSGMVSSSLTNIPPGGTTYGSWTQLLANTTYAGRLLTLRWVSGLAVGQQYFVDVGIGGAGSEVVVSPENGFIPPQTWSGSAIADGFSQEIWVPVPAAQRLAIRCWARGATATPNLACFAHLVD